MESNRLLTLANVFSLALFLSLCPSAEPLSGSGPKAISLSNLFAGLWSSQWQRQRSPCWWSKCEPHQEHLILVTKSSGSWRHPEAMLRAQTASPLPSHAYWCPAAVSTQEPPSWLVTSSWSQKVAVSVVGSRPDSLILHRCRCILRAAKVKCQGDRGPEPQPGGLQLGDQQAPGSIPTEVHRNVQGPRQQDGVGEGQVSRTSCRQHVQWPWTQKSQRGWARSSCCLPHLRL